MSFLEAAEGAGEVLGEPVLRWHRAAPSPRLARWLEELVNAGIDELTDFDVVELVAAAERIASWAQHLSRVAAAELSQRESMQPSPPTALALDLTPERVTGAEIAMRLGRTPRAAQRLVQEGRALTQQLAATGEALRTGRIDTEKAQVLVEGLDGVPGQLAVAVQDAVLPRAPERTRRQLANDVRAAIVELDPVEAEDRRRQATGRRRLTKPSPLPDGMAGMWLRTSAVEAHALYESIDAAARRARKAGDERTLGQLRADLLVERGLGGAGCAAVAGQHDGGHEGGHEGGHDDERETHHACPPPIRADIRVLVPLSTLVGTADEPAQLVGHGPIDPATARALARGGTWRRLVTDPTTGVVLDVGRSRYRPPSDLAELVRFRDGTCVRPGCGVDAWSSELDHTVPFSARDGGGVTAAHNLGALSKDCHDLKTHAGFELEQVSPGQFWWTTPTGHRYRRGASPPVRSLAEHDEIHELRNDLAELASITTDARAAQSPAASDVQGVRDTLRGDDSARTDLEAARALDPPPF